MKKQQLEKRIADLFTEEVVMGVLTKSPQLFNDLQEQIATKPEGWEYYPVKASRKLDQILQKLKKRGTVRYFYKKDGGPGWALP